MRGTNPILGSFAVIAVVTILQYAEGNVILAGDDTPVWTARCRHYGGCDTKDKAVEYKRLNKDIIKRTLNYWKSDEFQHLSFRTKKHRRSIEEDYADYEDEAYDFFGPEETEVELEPSAGNATRSKRENVLNRVQYGTVEASVLVMVDYDASAVTDKASRRRFVKEKILYTLAYWNSFNMRVWEIKGIQYKPHVQVKLVGIIIGLDRGATPYISNSDYAQDCLRKANTFWRNPPNKAEFPRDSYHAVATMTDVQPYGGYGNFEVVVEADNGNSPSILVWDNFNFWNLRSKAAISYKQAGDYLRQWAYGFPKVYDHMKPGKRLESILPGMLMSPEQQCALYGWEDLDRTCPEKSENCNLYCLNKGVLRFCTKAGPALDGTPCKNGVVG